MFRIDFLHTAAMIGLMTCVPAGAQTFAYEEEPHNYFSAPVTDPCTVLDQRLAAGALQLQLQDGKGLLRQVLEACQVPEASQVLVFSKTSLQKEKISPWQPRAVYFSEEAYIGWVPGGLIELAGIDPQLGPVFYFLNPDRPDRAVPRLDRASNCLDCHGSSMANHVPGVFIRSVYADRDGQMLLQAGTSLTDTTSPIEERWGGWYVTGTHGMARHMGNVTATLEGEGQAQRVRLDREAGANITSLERFFPAARYLRGTSDIVALMVLEHQTAMHSRLIEAAYDLRMAIVRQKALREELGEPPTEEYAGSTAVIARSHVEKIVKALLFSGEAPLPDGGIEGDGSFEEAFRANRKKDSDGRSLKDFQLLDRLFKYRCSYMIYSQSFAGLPLRFRHMIYDELWRILSATTPVPGYESLSASERRSILHILRETKDDLPGSWQEK